MKFTRNVLSTLPMTLGLIALSASLLFGRTGWEVDTCTDEEVWDGITCHLEWCVNSNSAYYIYICDDGWPTSKQCNGDCEEGGDM